MEVCRFTNGSEVYSLPSTTYIRGYTEVTHIIVNEAAHGISEDTFAALEPMLAIKHGHLYLFSTPYGCIGKFWEAWNNSLYVKIYVPTEKNKYVPKAYIEDQKKSMSAAVYDMEINGNFRSDVDNYFSIELLDRCTKEYSFRNFAQDGFNYYAGIDWGRIRDSSVVTVLSKTQDELKVENIIEMSGKPFSFQLERIKRLHSDYGFKKIEAEYAGLSINACEQLKEEGLPVELFTPTVDSKEEVYRKLTKTLEDGKLTLPKHRNLQYEMRLFRYEITASAKTKLHHAPGGSDDFVDSLCYANIAAEEEDELCWRVYGVG